MRSSAFLDAAHLFFQHRDLLDRGLVGRHGAFQPGDALGRAAGPEQRAGRLQQKSRHKGGRQRFSASGFSHRQRRNSSLRKRSVIVNALTSFPV